MKTDPIHTFIITAIAFCMPVYPGAVPPLIILAVICWLADFREIKDGWIALVKNKSVGAMAVLYLLYLIGVIYSEDKTDVPQILETKLSLIVFPLIFSSRIPDLKINLIKYLRFFIYGCLVSALICFIWALYCYIKPVYVTIDGKDYDLGASYFYYTRLSAFIHPSYISMYFNFALIAMYYLVMRGEIKMNWKWVLSVFVLSVFVLLLSSKAGWLGLFDVAAFVSVDLLRKRMVVPVIAIVILLPALFYFFNISAPAYSQRITAATESVEKSGSSETLKTSNDGTASRILVWEAAIDIIKTNFLIGTGTGDAKPAMISKYKEKGMTTEVEHKLNSHNQYLNTFIAIGVIGFSCLMACLLLPLYYSVSRQQILPGLFICLAGINFLFESMLETQSGVMFFGFFHAILCYYYLGKETKLADITKEK